MKAKRHAKILELISSKHIHTQEELQAELSDGGFQVTQATVSRDIKELRLIKSLSNDGSYHYTTHQKEKGSDLSFKFHAIFAESVRGVDYAQNLVVVKCYTGMANAACAALDSIHWDGLVGTIAGDDTILVVMRSEAMAERMIEDLNKLIH
ncbi:MAG: arginine repressor [Oscillospiraceae bacterium]|nr:arginine repressor [Oscillospiraceae bacterium]